MALRNRIFLFAGFSLAFFLAFSLSASFASAAWANATWTGYYPINSSMQANKPFAVNGTFGVAGNAVWTTNRTNLYVYCPTSACASFAIGNNTQETDFWYNEATGLGNNPTGVYTSQVNVRNVYNFADNLNDMSGNGKTGTIVDNPTYNASGKFGTALDFDGTNDGVAFASSISATPTTWSLELWYYQQVETGTLQFLADHYYDPTGWYLYINAGTLKFDSYLPNVLSSVAQPSLREWHYVVVTVNATHQALYVDGSVVDEDLRSSWSAFIAGTSTYLGIYRDNTSYEFNGLIDEVRLREATLTPTEIANNYKDGMDNLGSLGAWTTLLKGPSFSNQLASPASPQNYNFTYGSFGFQINCARCDNIIFEADFKGSATNYTAQIKNISTATYWINFTQSNMTVATHSYRWYGYNATAWVKDAQYSYTVNQANATKGISLSLDGNVSLAQERTYPNATHFALAENNTVDGACTYSIKENGTDQSSADYTKLLAARSYNITAFTNGCTNFTAGQTGVMLAVGKGATTLYLAINGTEGNVSVTYMNVTNVTAWLTVNGGTLSFFRNGTSVSNPEIIRLSAKVWNYTASLSHENYTAPALSRFLTISTADAAGAMTASPGWSVPENTQVTITATAGISYTLFKDGINISSPYVALLSFGIYNFTLVLADAENYTNPVTMQYLTVSSGGFGCTNNMTFAFYKTITTEYNYTVLNFSALLTSSMVRSNLTDVYVNTTALESSPAVWRNGTQLLVVNTTSQKTFTVKFGNYIGNWSWSSSPMPANYTNDTLATYSEYPYYYVLVFLEETTGVQQLPPGANRTVSLFCSNGVSSFSLNHSKIIVATFAPVQQARASISYSVTEVYSRNLILTSSIEYKNVYLVDANLNQVVQMLIELQDYTGDFGSAIFRVKKSLEGSLQTITENYFDAENKVLIYLINGDQYSIYIDNGVEERSMGNFYVDSVDLTKTLSIGDIYDMNLSSIGNISYRLYRRNATGYNDAIIFTYLDSAEQTRNVTMQVFNYTNVSQLLYTASSLNHSSVYFFYAVPDVNGSYIVRIHVNHTQFGESSWNWEEVFQAFVGVFLIPGLLPTIFPATYVQAMAFILLMGVPMLFSPPHGATAGVYVVLIAALLSFWNWYPVNIAILIFGLGIAVLNKLRSRT